LIALQIKSGPSYFKEEKDDHYVYRGEKKHLDYWLDHSLPVLIILYNPQNGICYWEYVKSEKVKDTGEGWSIKIPKTNNLNQSKDQILSHYVNPNRYAILDQSDTSYAGARRIDA